MMDGDLHVDAPPEELWAEIFRLRAQVKGPEGFETWYDAAVHERLRRVKAEKNALRYTAVRNFGDARDSSFYDHCDTTVDSFLTHLRTIDPTGYEILKRKSTGSETP
jgi:hypothetical protein